MQKAEFLTRFHSAPPLQPVPDHPLRKSGRSAAVLIPVVTHDNALSVLFTERAKHLKHHPGQVSFPGGKYEPGDPDLAFTAKREAWEEIALPDSHISIVGQLPPYRTISGFAMTAFVATVEPGFDLIPDGNEVSDTFEVPLSFLIDPRNYQTEYITRAGHTYPVYFIPWQNKMIWGATAALMNSLASIFTDNI